MREQEESLSAPATIAVLADIHGNRWALDAVLADADRAGVEKFVDLGDCVAGPLDPRGTAERLMALGAVTVRGNNDRAVSSGDSSPSAPFAREQLDDPQLAWLAELPLAVHLEGGLLACHGIPSDDTCYLLEEVVEEGVRRRDPEGVRALLGGIDAQVVLCGHTHLPRLLPLADGTIVVNPGSVGLLAYADDAPWPHLIESGSPHARYALLRWRVARWDVELRAISYPWDQAAAAARTRGREDWALALQTGLTARTTLGACPQG
jgi:predicted phosphodiesterase